MQPEPAVERRLHADALQTYSPRRLLNISGRDPVTDSRQVNTMQNRVCSPVMAEIFCWQRLRRSPSPDDVTPREDAGLQGSGPRRRPLGGSVDGMG